LGIEFGDASEGTSIGDCGLSEFCSRAEVIPGMRIFGVVLRLFWNSAFSFVHALQVQRGNAAVECRDFQIRVFGSGFFECFQSLLEQLLVHVGDADVVEAGGFGRFECSASRGCDKSKQEPHNANGRSDLHH
jgi:hypothetical protein